MMIEAEARQPFVAPHILELYPADEERRWDYVRTARGWDHAHRMRIMGAMSSPQGMGMKREIQCEHPELAAAKGRAGVGRLTWGWEIAPPLYRSLEDEARARGESPARALEFRLSWGLSETPADEPLLMARLRKRSVDEATGA